MFFTFTTLEILRLIEKRMLIDQLVFYFREKHLNLQPQSLYMIPFDLLYLLYRRGTKDQPLPNQSWECQIMKLGKIVPYANIRVQYGSLKTANFSSCQPFSILNGKFFLPFPRLPKLLKHANLIVLKTTLKAPIKDNRILHTLVSKYSFMVSSFWRCHILMKC